MTLRFINHNIASLHCNTDAQRADHHVRREAILVRMGEVQTNGGDRKSDGQNVRLKSYAKQSAEQLGVDERTVRRDLRRGKNIAPRPIVIRRRPGFAPQLPPCTAIRKPT